MGSTRAPRGVRATAGLALALAAIAGFVDAVGFVVLRGLFTAHMSGNAAQVGVRLGHGDTAAAVPLLVAIALFVCGVALGASVDGIAKRLGMRPRTAFVIGLQVVLVAGLMVYGEIRIGGGRVAGHGIGEFYVLAALAILAMGVQATTIRQVGGQSIRTTYISGVLTDLGRGLAERARGESGTAIGVRAGIVLLYLAGATLGSVLQRADGMWCLLIPLVALLVAIAADLRRPFGSSDRG